LIGVWVIQLWKDLGKPSKFNIVELGPGRGTLMSDIMKVAGKMREFLRAVHIHFVEVSPVLRKLQAKSLGVEYPEEQQHEADQEAPAQPAEKRPRIILSEADAAEDLMTKGHASLNAVRWKRSVVSFYNLRVLLVCYSFWERCPEPKSQN
jgi:hypothetical protein